MTDYHKKSPKELIKTIKHLQKQLAAASHYPELERLQRENARLKKQLKEQKEFIAEEIEKDGAYVPIRYTITGEVAEYDQKTNNG